MNQKELKELIEFLIEKDIAEFELERGDVKVRIRRAGEQPAHAVPDTRYFAVHATPPTTPETPPPLPASGAPVSAPATKEQTTSSRAGLHVVKSPIVGTFYESPSPGSPPFVKNGDKVTAGQVLCIVEAMKLMNEIEADVAGEIVERLVNNGQPIEYGQELFTIRPA